MIEIRTKIRIEKSEGVAGGGAAMRRGGHEEGWGKGKAVGTGMTTACG